MAAELSEFLLDLCRRHDLPAVVLGEPVGVLTQLAPGSSLSRAWYCSFRDFLPK